MSSAKLSIGGGLIEIATLATLIGASTSESLVLGTRGAAGLPVAAMSIFGSPFIIRACLSAATPDWLRETIGVKNHQADLAVGWSMLVDNVKEASTTRVYAKGVSLHLFNLNGQVNSNESNFQSLHTRFIYIFDGYTSTILHSCPTAEHGSPTHFSRYIRTSFWEERMRRQAVVDWLSILATSIKLLEAFLLWRYGSSLLALLTSGNWAWFFISATWLQSSGLSREYAKYCDSDLEADAQKGFCYDFLAGELPTVHSLGQHRAIIFNVPPSVREHVYWRISWAVGALVCAGTLVGTYIYIGDQSGTAFRLWLAFQVLWLLCRTMFFYFAYQTEGTQNGVMKPLTDAELERYRFRILSLASGVARHQALYHPRGIYCYEEDMQDAAVIQEAFTKFNHLTFELSSSVNIEVDTAFWRQETTEVIIQGVIGDTLLSSISWLLGKSYTCMDVYDCCLVFLQFNNQTIAIPAVRVLSGHVREAKQARSDLEAGPIGANYPKGAANDGVGLGWVFWIPLGSDQWLYHIGDLKVIGKHRMEVLTSREVTRRLHLAELFISLHDVKDVEEALERSKDIGKILMSLVKGHTRWRRI